MDSGQISALPRSVLVTSGPGAAQTLAFKGAPCASSISILKHPMTTFSPVMPVMLFAIADLSRIHTHPESNGIQWIPLDSGCVWILDRSAMTKNAHR